MEELFLWQDDPDCHFTDESSFKDDLADDQEFFDPEMDESSMEIGEGEEIGVEHVMGIGGALGGMSESTKYFNKSNDKPFEFISIKDAFRSSNEKAYPIRPFEKWVQDEILGKKHVDEEFDF